MNIGSFSSGRFEFWYTEIMGGIQIVDSTIEDAHEIGKVREQTWLDSYPNPLIGITKEDIEEKISQWTDEFIVNKIQDNDSQTWVAKDKGVIVGFIGVLKTEDENQIEALHILPDYQGYGIGTKLLETALNWFENSKKIIIDVVSYNEKAINFYKKFGFKETGEQSQDLLTLPSGKTIPKIIMVKSYLTP